MSAKHSKREVFEWAAVKSGVTIRGVGEIETCRVNDITSGESTD